MSDPYENPVFSGMVPAQMRGASIGDKGSAKVRTNQMGFSGGMVITYPAIVTYDGHDWYFLHFATVSVPSVPGNFLSPLVQKFDHVIEIHRNQGGMDIHAGGSGNLWPFVDQSDRQLKVYVLHYPNDSEDRRKRVLRTGIYY